MNETDLKCVKFVTATIVSGICILLLGLAAMWHWHTAALLTESMRSGYTEEVYPREFGTRWAKVAQDRK